jgi:hypothetical protein
MLLLELGFRIFSPFLSCWNGVNAQQKSRDMKPADLEVVLLAMEAAGDVGDFRAFKDSTVKKSIRISPKDLRYPHLSSLSRCASYLFFHCAMVVSFP